MEIERKYLIAQLPDNLEQYPCRFIEQAYLCTSPVLRIRRQDDTYILTYKGAGLLSREEYNLPLSEEAYRHLLPKTDGTVITKKRYLIPLPNGRTAELDRFFGVWEGLVFVEVEFPDEDASHTFQPPAWFGREVTFDHTFQNSWLSQHMPSDR